MIILKADGEYAVIATKRVTGNGYKFDGRMKFLLRRTSDGTLFTWLGSRQSKRVPANARLLDKGTDDMHAIIW